MTNESTFEDVVLTSLVDDPYGDITLVQGDITRTTCVDLPVTLAPGEAYECEFDAEFLGNAGDSLRNRVTGTANDDEGTVVTDRDGIRVFITDLPSEIVVTKATVPEPTGVPEPGDWVEFSITVDNVSVADEVTIDTLSDDVFGDITQDQAGLVRNTTCSVTPPFVLAPADPSGTADTYDCTFEGFVSGSAVDSPHRDVVTASGVDDDGVDVDASDDAEVEITDVLPTIVVDKTASSAVTATPAEEAFLPEPGGLFTFSVSVTNTSVEDVTITSLTDSVHGDLTDGANPALTSTTCTDAVGTVLAAPVPPATPGGEYSCEFSALYRTDINGILIGDAGDSELDTVTATAVDDDVPPGGGDSNTATDSDDATVSLTDALPTIEVDKTASSAVTTTPEEAFLPEPGGVFTFHVLVTNTSRAGHHHEPER